MNAARIILALVLGAGLTTFAQTLNLDADLQRAKQREAASGDCKPVLGEYARIAGQAAKGNRAVAAEALFRAAVCHETLHDGQAEETYGRVAGEFKDQHRWSEEASQRLTAMKTPPPATGGSTRRVAWTVPTGAYPFGRVSADGRYMPFAASTGSGDQLWVHDLLTGGDRPLARGLKEEDGHLASNGSSAFSRQGDRIAYSWRPPGTAQRQEIRIADVTKETPPRTLLDDDRFQFIYPQDWSPDGRWIALELETTGPSQVGILSTTDGTLRILRTGDECGDMAFSPDGTLLAFDTQRTGTRGRDVFVMPIDGGPEVPVIVRDGDDRVLGWSSDGSLIVGSDHGGAWQLLRQRMTSGHAAGAAILLANDVGQIDRALGAVADRVWTLKIGAIPKQVKVAVLDDDRHRLTINEAFAADGTVGTWSRDGRTLAVLSTIGSVFAPTAVISLRAADTGDVIRELKPRIWDWPAMPTRDDLNWSPDDRQILAPVEGDKGYGIYTIDVLTGDVSPVVMGTYGAEEGLRLVAGGWSADGKVVYYRRGVRGALIARDITTGTERTLCEAGPPKGPGRSPWPVAVSSSGSNAYCPRMVVDDPASTPAMAIIERDLRSGAEREVARGDQLQDLWISPNDEALAFRGSRSLVVVSLRGVPSQKDLTPADASGLVTFAGWTAGGQVLLAREQGQTRLWGIPVDGQKPVRLDGDVSGNIRLSADGRRLAFVVSGTAAPTEVREYVLPAIRR